MAGGTVGGTSSKPVGAVPFNVDEKRYRTEDAVRAGIPISGRGPFSLRELSGVVVRDALIKQGAGLCEPATWADSRAGVDFVSDLVKQVISGEQWAPRWAEVLQRCVVKENGMRIYIAVGAGTGAFLYAPSASISNEAARGQLEAFAYDDQLGRLVPESEVRGSEAKKNGLDDVETKTRQEGQEQRVFEIGADLAKAVNRLVDDPQADRHSVTSV
jgi:hypothetical protein